MTHECATRGDRGDVGRGFHGGMTSGFASSPESSGGLFICQVSMEADRSRSRFAWRNMSASIRKTASWKTAALSIRRLPSPITGRSVRSTAVGFHPMAGQGGSRMIARFIPHHDYLRIGHGFIDRIATSGCPPRRSTRGLRPGAKLAQSALLVSSRRRNSWGIQEPYGWSGIGPSFAGGQERARIQSFVRIFSHSGRLSS